MKTTYFFGYGSLIAPDGINGRGMKYVYSWKDLTAAFLKGYRRSMCAYHLGYNWYGLLESHSKTGCNGVLFQIHSLYDYEALLYNESSLRGKSARMVYEPVNVADLIEGPQTPKDTEVITLVCTSDRSGEGKKYPDYIRICWEYAQGWPPQFRQQFLETGGLKES